MALSVHDSFYSWLQLVMGTAAALPLITGGSLQDMLANTLRDGRRPAANILFALRLLQNIKVSRRVCSC